MIRRGCHLEEDVHIGSNFDTGYNVVIRRNVKIGNNVCIWSNTVIDPGVIIGNNVRIHVGCYVSQNVIIEDDVFIGPGTIVLNDRYPPRFDQSDWEPPIIKKGSVIGGGVVILPGTVINSDSIVGGASVIIKDVPCNQIWAGHPARRLR